MSPDRFSPFESRLAQVTNALANAYGLHLEQSSEQKYTLYRIIRQRRWWCPWRHDVKDILFRDSLKAVARELMTFDRYTQAQFEGYRAVRAALGPTLGDVIISSTSFGRIPEEVSK